MTYEYDILYLTEKDSQVQALSVVLDAKYTGKWEAAFNKATKTVICPLQGHVLTGLEPQEYNPKWGEYGEESIFLFPDEYKLKPNPSSQRILNQALTLIKKSKVIVIATDSDNEGAAIGMNVIKLAGAEDRIERMLPMGSTHPDELRKAIDNPIDIPYLRMAQTGSTRAFLDWIEGMSLSRALSFYIGNRGKVKLNFGGVKTPLIYVVVERDLAFESHEKSYFWTVTGEFNGVIVKVKRKTVVKNKKGVDEIQFDEKFETEQSAKAAAEYLKSKVSKIGSFSRKNSKSSPPKLYELAGLQADMSKKYKIRPSATMDIGQKLYDFPVSLQTYPRTDVPYLKDAEFVDVIPILKKLGDSGIIDKNIIKNILAKPIPKRSSTFNNKEVVAHGAIVPTLKGDIGKYAPKMEKFERAVFDFVCMRYVANFMDDYEFIDVKGETELDNDLICSFGENIPTVAGWKEIYEKGIFEKIAEYESKIPASLKKGDSIQIVDTHVTKNETKPKPQFTMDTLLKAMENISNLFPDSKEIKEFLGDAGIGTNATRAKIIDDVLSPEKNNGEPWLTEEKGVVKSTQKAKDFIKMLPVELVSPIKRALMSKKLKSIERGEVTPESVLAEYKIDLRTNIDNIIAIAKERGVITSGSKQDLVSLGECPVCKGDINEREKLFICSNASFRKTDEGFINDGCEYKVFKGALSKLGKDNITAKELSDVLHKGSKLVSLKSMKTGKAYNGKMIIDLKWGVKIDFSEQNK
jgi:DNA topoisomerase-3